MDTTLSAADLISLENVLHMIVKKLKQPKEHVQKTPDKIKVYLAKERERERETIEQAS